MDYEVLVDSELPHPGFAELDVEPPAEVFQLHAQPAAEEAGIDVRREVPGADVVVAQVCSAHNYDDPGQP